MTMTGREILVHLIALTPEPTAELDAERLLLAFEAVLAARAAVLVQLVPPIELADGDRPLLTELERRQALWQSALADALRTIGEQRCSNAQVRAYAQQPG